ncbi:MAG: hypothetical protein IT385_04570 [Deltaproteobacteria bacterium]|nr:hypothetical protein [Deltaproteobacteria bacterium]
MNDPARALGAALDAQASILEAMVLVSQRQIAAILAYRADLRRDGPDELEAARAELSALTRELEAACDDVTRASDRIAPGLGPVRATAHLGPLVRQSIHDKLSTVRSLAQALGELQRVTQFHAQRGLQIVHAWKSLMDAGQSAGTYSRRGNARRVGRITEAPPRVLEVDI